VPIIGCVLLNMEIRVFQRKRVQRPNSMFGLKSSVK
jgi:hypothetical protein